MGRVNSPMKFSSCRMIEGCRGDWMAALF